MSSTIHVRLNQDDNFVVRDPDTGEEKVLESTTLHSSQFIVDLSVKRFFCNAFGPHKDDWVCTDEALERIQSITDFNCISDEVRY